MCKINAHVEDDYIGVLGLGLHEVEVEFYSQKTVEIQLYGTNKAYIKYIWRQ